MILNNADNIKLGSAQVEAVYLGADQVWGSASYAEITGAPPVEFTTTATAAADYRIYGPIEAGALALAVREPRSTNLIKWPYYGLVVCPKDAAGWSEADGVFYAGWDFSVLTNSSAASFDATVSTTTGEVYFPQYATNANNPYKFHFVVNGTMKILQNSLQYYDPDRDTLYPAGTYTFSYIPQQIAWTSGQMEVKAINAQGTIVLDTSDYWSLQEGIYGKITFTINEPCYITISYFCAGLYYGRNGIKAMTMKPQLELASSPTEYEALNTATVTTVTLTSDLTAGEYLSFADQKRYPGGTAVTMPALATIQGDNVLTIDSDPGAENDIYVKYQT